MSSTVEVLSVTHGSRPPWKHVYVCPKDGSVFVVKLPTKGIRTVFYKDGNLYEVGSDEAWPVIAHGWCTQEEYAFSQPQT